MTKDARSVPGNAGVGSPARSLVEVLVLLRLLDHLPGLPLGQGVDENEVRLGIHRRFQDLAQEFDVSERTVQRDLEVLQDLGFPIEHDQDEHGKRFWRMPGDFFSTGPFVLSLTEAVSLHLAQGLFTPLAGTHFAEGLDDILEKIRSVVPQQALALSNSKLALEMAEKIAARFGGENPDLAEFVAHSFEAILARKLDADEKRVCLEFCEAMRTAVQSKDAERRIRIRLVHALLNHNDFVTIR